LAHAGAVSAFSHRPGPHEISKSAEARRQESEQCELGEEHVARSPLTVLKMKQQINLQIQALLLKALSTALDERRLMTEAEVAEIFGVNIFTIRRWRKAELISHYQLEGGDVRYAWKHVNARMADLEQLSRSETRERRALAALEKVRA
jgi:hypothetical protein